MPFYEYEGQCPGGTAIEGTIEAVDLDAAMAALDKMQVQAVQVTQSRPPTPKRTVGYDDFIFFNEQLASLASTGSALDRGLREVATDIRSRRLRHRVEAIADEVEKGTPLDEAVAAQESGLPVLYSRVIRAGIRAGDLSAALLNLSQHLRFIAESRRIALESLSYPVVVLLLALGVCSGVILWLIPEFESVVVDFGSDGYGAFRLPLLTAGTFAFARVYPFLLGMVCVIGVIALAYWLLCGSTAAGRLRRERMLLVTPIVGRLLRVSLVARFLRSVSLAVASGIPLPEVLRVAAASVGSPVLGREADAMAGDLDRGESAGEAGRNHGRLIPALFGYVVDTAVERNMLPQALTELARTYEMRAAHYQSLLRTWLMPLALLVVAAAVGLIIVAMYLPLVAAIRSMTSSISGV